MPLEIISSNEALGNLKSNQLAKYPNPDEGRERLFPFPRPEAAPSFFIDKTDSIFTMGSCFAREVDNALSSYGFNVTSRQGEFSAPLLGGVNPDSLFNKYTIHSIHNEIKWATESEKHPEEKAFVNVGNNKWVDPQLGGNSLVGSLKELILFRTSYSKVIKNIVSADVIILTLGLVEVWYDKQSKLFLNVAPPIKYTKKHPDRFELVTLDYNDIVEELESLYELIIDSCKQGVKLLITVSPVPLLNTFRDQDVLLANTYSKSVQRAAVESFVSKHSKVDYFPSYEFVALGNPNFNWAHDYRHVAPSLVRTIMANVLSKYVKNNEYECKKWTHDINALYKSKEYDLILKYIEAIDIETLDGLALYRVGLTYKKSGQLQSALDIFILCSQKESVQLDAIKNVITVANKLGNAEIKSEYIELHEINYPEDKGFRKKYLNKEVMC